MELYQHYVVFEAFRSISNLIRFFFQGICLNLQREINSAFDHNSNHTCMLLIGDGLGHSNLCEITLHNPSAD